MKKQSKIGTLSRMVKLVKPLTGFMILAVTMGTLGFLCAQFIPVLGGFAVLHGLNFDIPLPINAVWVLLIVFALVRAVLRYTEQRTNHYIAFTLLAIIRDRVFKALRRLCPAKLEGRDKGDLISLITSDVELLEVFYAHTISPMDFSYGIKSRYSIDEINERLDRFEKDVSKYERKTSWQYNDLVEVNGKLYSSGSDYILSGEHSLNVSNQRDDLERSLYTNTETTKETLI